MIHNNTLIPIYKALQEQTDRLKKEIILDINHSFASTTRRVEAIATLLNSKVALEWIQEEKEKYPEDIGYQNDLNDEIVRVNTIYNK